MKKIAKILSLILALVFALSLFTACGESGAGKEKDGKDYGGRIGLIPIEGLSEYKIIRSDSNDEAMKSIATELKKTLKEKFGVEIAIGTDYGAASSKEILLGLTKRTESQKAAEAVTSDNSYTVRQSGDRIVIYGGSNEALVAAIEKWTEEMVDPKGRLCIPINEDGYLYEPVGVKLDKISINGEKLQGMSIYAKDPILAIYAEQIKALFEEYADVKLDVVSNKMPEKGIILDFDSENYRTESISVENGLVKITPAYGNPKFVYEKLKEILDSANSRELDITSNFNSSSTIDYGDIYTKEELMKLLQKVYDSDAVIVGELLDFGSNKNKTLVSSGLEYFKSETGEYPGIYSIEVSSSFAYIKDGGDDLLHIAEELIGYASNGGIIEAHSHMSCPANPHTYREGNLNYEQWDELFEEGSELHTAFMDGLSYTADFLEMLDEMGVPVIWRPYHEINGNWFWWGAGRKDGAGKTQLEANYYKKLWTITYEYLTETRDLDNLIWVYNPNIGETSETLAEPLFSYPGDEYVDIVGIDWYSNGDYFVLENTPTYKDLATTGKMINMCEFGLSGDALVEPDKGEKGEQKELFSTLDALTYIKEMNKSGYKTAYWLFWQGNSSITGMGYGDQFMQSELTLGLSETSKMLDEIRG